MNGSIKHKCESAQVSQNQSGKFLDFCLTPPPSGKRKICVLVVNPVSKIRLSKLIISQKNWTCVEVLTSTQDQVIIKLNLFLFFYNYYYYKCFKKNKHVILNVKWYIQFNRTCLCPTWLLYNLIRLLNAS